MLKKYYRRQPEVFNKLWGNLSKIMSKFEDYSGNYGELLIEFWEIINGILVNHKKLVKN